MAFYVSSFVLFASFVVSTCRAESVFLPRLLRGKITPDEGHR